MLIKVAYNKKFSPGIKCIKLVIADELAKSLQEEKF
jgi:hypothetical protein